LCNFGINLIQEVFLESDWEEASQARAARDERASQLQAEGLTCSCSTLYRITDGRKVFLVEAQTPEDEAAERQPSKRSSSPRRPRKDKGSKKVDYR
jgi:hypothetical protein